MRWVLRIVVVALVSLMAAQLARAASYYVDPLGDDANPGTVDAPWRTVQHAAHALAPGDTVLVGAGVYTEAVVITQPGTAELPITYQGLAGAILESPDPDASLSAFDVRDGVSHVIIDGFEIRGGYHETIYVRAGASTIAVRNCDVHNNRVGIWIQSASGIEIEGCHVHGNTARGLRVTGASAGVSIRSTESSANNDGWGCFGDADGFAVEEAASDVEFIDCVARNNSEDGFDIQGDDVRILRSEARDNGCTGIKIWQNGRIENSIVAGNNLGISTASYFNVPTTVEIVNTTVVDNAAQQLYLRQPVISPPANYQVVLHNVIVTGAGKAIEAGSAVVIAEDHNILFRPDTTEPVVVRYLPSGGEQVYTGQDVNAGVWKAESGQGAGTWAISPDFADPNNYRPSFDSVAVDTGDSVDAPLDDIERSVRPQGLTFDLGAFETSDSLSNHRPWADPGPNRIKIVGHRVDFTAYGSVDVDSDPITYSWDFGDGSATASGYAVSHTYSAVAEYTVTLTVSDGNLSRSRAALIDVVPAPTQTPTVTSTPTGALPPTSTPTSTGTPTHTDTPEPTLTGTIPPTSPVTWAGTPTHTDTPEPTLTGTIPPTSTVTWTGTPTHTPTPTAIVSSRCGAAPRFGCRRAGKTTLVLARSLTKPNVRVLRWKWLHGEATHMSDFGDPVGGETQYALCLFGESGTETRLLMSVDVPAAGVCRGVPCWDTLSNGGFGYTDRDRTADGVTRMVLKAGTGGNAKVVVGAGGMNLPLPLMPLDQNGQTTVQFVNSEGECWEGVYPAPAVVNRDTQFKNYSRN
jgi:parallel beta-helix repeat protein